MWQILEKEIERKARNILAKERRSEASAKKHSERFTHRTGIVSIPSPYRRPSYWDYDKHFDPIYCIDHARFLAKRIWSKINSKQYEPKPAILFEIDKPDGGSREIMSFAIPDSAVANVFHRRITDRNKGIFSAYSFAYRPDKTVIEAIIHLNRMMQPSKTFILKYDYSKYFDTIDHDYLKKLIDKQNFVITNAERIAISAFLKHRYAEYPSWQTMQYRKRTLGVPQGSSLSLFLSNIAAHELDMTLERLKGWFVRFADDVIAVAHSYSDARNIELEFRSHCERSGVKINLEKSSGITLLEKRSSDDRRQFFLDVDDGSHLKKISHVDFLGHQVSSDEINLTRKAIKRIKRKISQIIYIHLLQYSNQGHPINPDRIGGDHLDWDLITCINEIRIYIYGGLKERDLDKFIEEDQKLPIVRGLMAFYPLITHVEKLAALDGWLVNVVSRAVRERNKAILGQGLDPYVLNVQSLLAGSWYGSDIPNESRMPSFVKGWRAARKFYKRYGLSEVRAPSYYALLSAYS
ncbi:MULTISPECIES: reverse transcriptase domain-containing protein [Sphingobium]|uniref:reverse transcriptase domain-containing protein n=1 Tax=Sphingobium TaxID=165695 RepID=UPI0015EBA90C|nr:MULTISPECIES: reverse transcriptase domain-containing protein [Sphingobium]MCW2362668.1 retron-type reverse transcriptase [Sphingobium sp. B10D3B]MCW2400652.1 retron-type reverse transcriptase [Sphingobium sp. B10D7B]MCW2407631.1 retron-type reverse transcriptase [Sphingobium xanthum]